jgi:hypothetical protein
MPLLWSKNGFGYIFGDFFTYLSEAGSLKILGQSELRHISKDDLFTICEKVVTELWLSYYWPKIFKQPVLVTLM